MFLPPEKLVSLFSLSLLEFPGAKIFIPFLRILDMIFFPSL